MEAHAARALALAQWLEQQPRVSRVYYPGLVSHPQYALAQQQQRLGGGIVSFEVKPRAGQTEQEAAKKKAGDKAKAEADKKAAEPSRAEKKKQMLADAKDKVEVKVKTKEYEEKLMGNSKLLQDPTGKIKPR
jgi:cystathionine beta-lyase/cystathionine gamma-synthase